MADIAFDAPVHPDALTAFVREVPIPAELKLTGMFPAVYKDSNRFDWSEVIKTNRTARFRAFDGRVHVSARDGGSDRWVPLPPLSTSFNMGELERLQLEFARTGGTRTQALAAATYNDGQNGVRYVRNRMEQAIGEVLTTGKLTINENGFQAEADFDLDPTHKPTAATAYTDSATAPALDNLIAWADALRDGGAEPGELVMSQRVKRLLQKNKQIIDAEVGSTSGRSRINDEQLINLFASEGLPTSITIVDNVLDVDGVTTRVVPDDRIVMLPADRGSALQVVWGLTATALELVNSNESDMSFTDAPGIVGITAKEGVPFRQFVFVDAVGMPVLVDPTKLLVAKVI